MKNILLGNISEKEFLEKMKSKKWRHQFMSGAIAKSLAISVREMRKSQGLTQAQLGKLAGMSAARISVLETKKGMESVSIRTLWRLAKVFDCALVVKFESWEDTGVLRGFVSWVIGFTPDGCVAKKFINQASK